MERVKGIEPSYLPWQGSTLPLSYTRYKNIITYQYKKNQINFIVIFITILFLIIKFYNIIVYEIYINVEYYAFIT